MLLKKQFNKLSDDAKNFARNVGVRLGAVGAGVGLAAANSSAFAQSTSGGVDASAVVTALGQAGTQLALVGVAIIGALVIAVGYKWIKGMMFG